MTISVKTIVPATNAIEQITVGGTRSSLKIAPGAIVEIQAGRAQIASFHQVGKDLIVVMPDGAEIVLEGYFDNAEGAAKKLILVEETGPVEVQFPAADGSAADGVMHDVVPAYVAADADTVALLADSGAQGAGADVAADAAASGVSPVLLGLLGVGGVAAIAGGGGGGGSSAAAAKPAQEEPQPAQQETPLQMTTAHVENSAANLATAYKNFLTAAESEEGGVKEAMGKFFSASLALNEKLQELSSNKEANSSEKTGDLIAEFEETKLAFFDALEKNSNPELVSLADAVIAAGKELELAYDIKLIASEVQDVTDQFTSLENETGLWTMLDKLSDNSAVLSEKIELIENAEKFLGEMKAQNLIDTQAVEKLLTDVDKYQNLVDGAKKKVEAAQAELDQNNDDSMSGGPEYVTLINEKKAEKLVQSLSDKAQSELAEAQADLEISNELLHDFEKSFNEATESLSSDIAKLKADVDAAIDTDKPAADESADDTENDQEVTVVENGEQNPVIIELDDNQIFTESPDAETAEVTMFASAPADQSFDFSNAAIVQEDPFENQPQLIMQ